MKINRQLAQAVTDYLNEFESEKVPNNWHTLVELGERVGVQERQAGNIAKRFVKVGQCEVKNFRIKVGQYIRPVRHYRFSRGARKALGL